MGVAVSAALLLLFCVSPAYAIPAPDLIAGSLSSLSQIATVLSAMIGGLAFSGPRLLGSASGGAKGRLGRGARWIAIVAGVLLTGSLALNLYQYLGARDARLSRLQGSLVRPTREPGTPVLDPTLKELSYAQQRVQRDGITTRQLQALLRQVEHGSARNVNFIDVREPAEVKTGTLPNFTPIRAPDLLHSSRELAGKRNVLLCQNGNRSSAICDALNKRGIPCNFVIGGLSKWIAEGRPVESRGVRRADELRGVPGYPNDRVLLDTPAVHKLIARDKAIVLDTRYPGQFAAYHMPYAIDIPVRRLPTAELDRRIKQLPRRPVILACYDRRSCFFSQVLGYELSRAGFDVRGRYTVPWEYFVAPKPPPYIAEWRERIGAGVWSRAKHRLGRAIIWLGDRGFGLIGAILLLALLSRLTILPFSLKQERDQIRLREIQDEVARLKERAGDDKRRFARGLTALHRRHGITPGRNLIALLFLPVLAVSVAAVDSAARQGRWAFFWIPDLSMRDPWLLLPLAFAVLVSVYIVLAVARTRRQRVLSFVLGVPIFTALSAYLHSAADLYMVASACLMLAQRGIAAIDFTALREAGVKRRAVRRGVIPLAQAHLLPGCGNKAARLGALLAAGIDVPRGLVLTPTFLARFREAGETARRRDLAKIWRALGADRIAVRSAASAEDGSAHSFAGVFDTVLNVARAQLNGALDTVLASFRSERTTSYGVAAGDSYILLQPMVPAEYAGVLFTAAPGSEGLAMIEMVEGTAEAMVSGTVSPESYLLGRITGRHPDGETPPIDLAPLVALGRRAEDLFGAPQDIEWAFCEGRFRLLQSRDITRSGTSSDSAGSEHRLERERGRVLAGISRSSGQGPVLVQNELSELLPRPTALSLDMMTMLWEEGGSVDLACRALGLSYRIQPDASPYLETVFGRLYVNRLEERQRAPRIGPLAALRLERAARTLERDYRDRFLPEFRREVGLLDAIDFRRLSRDRLQEQLERVRSGFLSIYAQVEVINIAASFFVERARAAVAARGLNPATALGGMPETPLTQALRAAGQFEDEDERIKAFLALFGHRAAFDYELSERRFREDLDVVRSFVLSPPPEAPATPPRTEEWGDRSLAEAVGRARLFQVLKEEAKHESLRQIAVLRNVLLEIDRVSGLRGGIFDLTFAEISELGDGAALEPVRAVIAERRRDRRAFERVSGLATAIGIEEVEALEFGAQRRKRGGEGELAGTVVSGNLPAEGRACTVPVEGEGSGRIPPHFADGDIIVTRMVDPSWLPYLRRAGGVVCEIGGWLSHVAILAREHGIPMVVGVTAWDSIQMGERVKIEPEGRIERLVASGSAAADSPTVEPPRIVAVGD